MVVVDIMIKIMIFIIKLIKNIKFIIKFIVKIIFIMVKPNKVKSNIIIKLIPFPQPLYNPQLNIGYINFDFFEY